MKRQMKIDVVSSFQLKRTDFLAKQIESSILTAPLLPSIPFIALPSPNLLHIPCQQLKLYGFFIQIEFSTFVIRKKRAMFVFYAIELNTVAHKHNICAASADGIPTKSRAHTIETKFSVQIYTKCLYLIVLPIMV